MLMTPWNAHSPKVAYVDPFSNSPRSDTSSDEGNNAAWFSVHLKEENPLPFDVEEQKIQVAEERWRHHIMWCDRLAEKQRMSFPNRRISLKMLLNEAFQRDVQECRRRGEPMSRKELTCRWNDIGRQMLRDMEHGDHSDAVLRKLSCMSVFTSESICREYGENPTARFNRMERMMGTLRTLKAQNALFSS
eukprot:CAMPEP_0176417142 /NCGR_PEP_ID=MMETSP0127-20121128/6727_1 /TAXON_ID=938130 /ORGANISM="Platyophrya macrostoma, Strain WH" /LENGTH=189 /DNA_ID=CAMNT_0017797275 /DNA_START=76 /DNA_END=645 /DNA_ORIENTATION=+